MTAETSNDNLGSLTAPQGPDAHGQAAVLLVESLIHGLVARHALSLADAVEIVESATEIEREMATERGASVIASRTSLDLLDAIGNSLKRDLPRD